MSKRVKAGSHELRSLARRLPRGVELISDGKAKVRLVSGGRQLRYRDGRPISMPNSPAPQTLRNLEKRLRAEGLIE